MAATYFHRSVCLSLDKRADQQPRIREEFGKLGIDVEFFQVGDGVLMPPEWYDLVNVDTPPGWGCGRGPYNVNLSYHEIIKRARKDGVGSLLLLEDDVGLTADAAQVLAKAWRQLEEHDAAWHMLYLGANHTWHPTDDIDTNLLRLHGSLCWHAVALRSTIFDPILNLQMTGPMDLISTALHEWYGCYAVWPSIAVQLPGHSYCQGAYQDYIHFFRNKGTNHPIP